MEWANPVIPPQPRPQPAVTSPPPNDSRNTIVRPIEPQSQFSLSEGTYQLRDEITLGLIPSHPSENATPANNVLDTKPLPPTAGTSISLAILAPRKNTTFRRRSLNAPGFKRFLPSNFTDSSYESAPSESDYSSSRTNGLGGQTTKNKFGEGNPALPAISTKEFKDPAKRRKPKSSISKSSSSFISRTIPHESLSKRIQEHKDDGIYAFANVQRGLLWLDLSAQNKHEQLMKILFTKAHALCHDFNETSKTPSHLEVVLGFNTSEFIWFEAMSQKYSRLNKNSIINSSPVSQVQWLPGSENLFISAHFDGTLTVYDKEKDDAVFSPEDGGGMQAKVSSDGKRLPRLIVKKSVQSKNQKNNPLAFWKATNQRINGIAFSPDGRLLALACEDGSLRILDYLKEELVDLYRSYYGGLTCVCWSPDGLYILTGGQDDLVSIWSVEDRILVARCVGHRSWISSLSFDPWRCDESTYRFGSVGEDGKLLLWDFSVDMLVHPQAASVRQSISSYAPTSPERHASDATVIALPSEPTAIDGLRQNEDEITHAVLPRAAVAMLPPVMSKEVDAHALTSLKFEEDCIIVSCKSGHIRTWDRPDTDLASDDASGTR